MPVRANKGRQGDLRRDGFKTANRKPRRDMRAESWLLASNAAASRANRAQWPARARLKAG